MRVGQPEVALDRLGEDRHELPIEVVEQVDNQQDGEDALPGTRAVSVPFIVVVREPEDRIFVVANPCRAYRS